MGLTSIVLAAMLSTPAYSAQPPKPYTPPPQQEVRIMRYAIVRDEQYEAERRIARHTPDDDGFEPRSGYRKTDYARRLGRG